MKRPRVILADDHKIVLEGLKSILEPEFELVGTAEDGRALVSAAQQLTPDVVVTDISMPSLNGIDATSRIKKADPRVKVILLTMHPDVTYATRALEVGASGYVLKHAASSELLTAIREALKGRVYLTPMVAEDVLKYYREGSRGARSEVVELTSRQREVLQLVAEGHSAKEISSILHISTRTVEFHKYRMMEILNLQTNAELIEYAIRHGIASV